jgi:hypothetical protein
MFLFEYSFKTRKLRRPPEPDLRNLWIHRATCSCIIEVAYFCGFFLQLVLFAGLVFLYISLILQDTPPYCNFSHFFCILFAGRIGKAAMGGAGGGNNLFHSLGDPVERNTPFTRVV